MRRLDPPFLQGTGSSEQAMLLIVELQMLLAEVSSWRLPSWLLETTEVVDGLPLRFLLVPRAGSVVSVERVSSVAVEAVSPRAVGAAS